MTDPANNSSLDIKRDPRGVILPVRAQAGARRSAVVGVQAGMLRVAVTAAPEKGKANKAITDVLSKFFGVSKSSVVLLSGETAPRKKFLLVGLTFESLRDAITSIVADGR
jgi:uncharacterized protein (TIGR00251 family)